MNSSINYDRLNNCVLSFIVKYMYKTRVIIRTKFIYLLLTNSLLINVN